MIGSMMEAFNDSVMRRIQKLLAIANDNRGNANEVASAATMAKKMMDKYQIEMQDIILQELNRPDFMQETEIVKGTITLADWMNWLSVHTAKMFDVRAVLVTVPIDKKLKAQSLKFQGYTQDVDVAAWTFHYFVSQILAGADHYSKNVDGRSRRRVNRSFCQGMALGICHTIEEYILENAKISTGTALVVAKKEAIEEKYGKLKLSKNKDVKVNPDFGAGRDAGLNVDIGRRAIDGNLTNNLTIGE